MYQSFIYDIFEIVDKVIFKLKRFVQHNYILLRRPMATMFNSIFSQGSNITTTTNGDMAFKSTENYNLDFYGTVCRSDNEVSADLEYKILRLLPLMWAENPLICLKNIFAKRNVLHGAGEKKIFNICYNWLLEQHPSSAYKNLVHVPHYGYYKDLLNLLTLDDPVRTDAILKIFALNLHAEHSMHLYKTGKVTSVSPAVLEESKNPNFGLCCKWAPSLNSSYDKKYKIATKLSKLLFNVTGVPGQKLYRKFLSDLRAHYNIVEKKMCSNSWDDIALDKVPSIAMNNYKKAFEKHMPDEFEQWKSRISDGTGKINASLVPPHKLIKDLDNSLTQIQWDALVADTKARGGLNSIVPVCDVSGSMEGIPMDVSISLGILISQVTAPPFNDAMITFSDNPTFYKFEGDTLKSKVHKIHYSGSTGLNTDIVKTFRVLLNKCVENNVSHDNMPKAVLILTDAQFDSQTRNSDKTSFSTIKKMYSDAGYPVPTLVLWNLSGAYNNVPFTKHESGAILISGWSPKLLSTIIKSGLDVNPEDAMVSVLNDPMYDRLSIASD